VTDTLFISDLHLSDERPEITALFLNFLRNAATRAGALYILGDLFEVWLGDDAVLPTYQPVLEGLRALAGGGTPVNVMHGNRDFLMGEAFARQSGCRLIPDPTVIDLNGERTLLMHGDTLCSDDVEYQQFRMRVRNPGMQRQFLALPLDQRIAVAKQYRNASREHARHKAEEIMDVNQQTVAATMREYGVQQLIHGHTHRPAVHSFSLDGRPARRIVLGDWYEQGSLLKCDGLGCRLEAITGD
jgi:UDP-2,3-diacylglucosamine hydrolase